MAIRTSKPPDSNLQELHAGMERMGRHVSLWRHPELDADDGVPHTTHNLRLDNAAAGGGVAAAGLVGWRYFLGDPAHTAPTAAAEVHGAPGAEVFAGINAGPFVAESIAAIERAHTAAELPGEYEPRLLRVPALYIVAIWLRDDEAAEDVIIPLPSSHPGLQPRPYRREEFADALRRVADQHRQDSALAPG